MPNHLTVVEEVVDLGDGEELARRTGSLINLQVDLPPRLFACVGSAVCLRRPFLNKPTAVEAAERLPLS